MPNTPAQLVELFPSSAAIDRGAASVEARMVWGKIPAKCAVYLLATGENGDEPLLLATVGNLRAALQRRLADMPVETQSKRIPYGQVCTRVHWRIVHSQFAANWWYWRAARQLFPKNYRELVPFRPAWWISLDRDGAYPEFRRTQEISDPASRYWGPIRDRTATGKLIDTMEDLFDLCRYHSILVQAPHGKPCAYKEMGKCPAPCDGSVPMSWYFRQLDRASEFLRDRTQSAWRAEQTAAMKAAAAQLQFETAARIKQRLARADLLAGDAYAQMRPLADFTFLALQPGQGKPFVEPWLIHFGDGGVMCLPQIRKKDLNTGVQELFERCRGMAETPVAPPLSGAAIEQIAIVAHHLLRNQDDGVYLRLREITGSEVILAAAIELMERKSARKPLTEQASDQAGETPASASNQVVEDTPPAEEQAGGSG